MMAPARQNKVPAPVMWYKGRMTPKALREILERAETWPEEAQEEAVNFLLALDQELADPYVLTEEDRAAIERGLDDMRHGRFASDEEVSAVFPRRG